jgi:hypothetical protein
VCAARCAFTASVAAVTATPACQSVCTATAAVCVRRGAVYVHGERRQRRQRRLRARPKCPPSLLRAFASVATLVSMECGDDGGSSSRGTLRLGASAGSSDGARAIVRAGDTRPSVSAHTSRKRTKAQLSTYTTSWTTVSTWGAACTQKVFGLHDKATRQETDKARQLLLSAHKIVCYDCGSYVGAHKKTFMEHVETAACKKAHETQVQLNAEAAQQGRSSTLLWSMTYAMLMAVDHQRRNDDEGERAAKIARVQYLASATLSSYDVSYNAQATLFASQSPLRGALAFLGPSKGLGSHKTAAKYTHNGIELVQREVIASAMQYAIANDLPIAVGVDESPTANLGSRPILMVHVFHAGLADTLCVDIAQLHQAPSALRLADGIKSVMVREGFLTEREWDEHVQILAGDHAAYVKKAARDMGLEFSGDPPHALDLMLKAILNECGLKTLLMSIRALLNGKSYVIARIAAAFGIPASAYKVPTHRWGYFINLCTLIATPRTCAQLQQLLVWMAVNLYGGNQPLSLTSAELFADIPFTCRQLATMATAPSIEIATEGDAYNSQGSVINLDPEDGINTDWDDSVIEVDEDEREEDRTDTEEGSSRSPAVDEETSDSDDTDGPGASASFKGRKLQQILQVLRLLTNPIFLTHIRLICDVSNPLRQAQLHMQRADGRSPDVLVSMRGAYDALASYLDGANTAGAIQPASAVTFLRLATVMAKGSGGSSSKPIDDVLADTTPDEVSLLVKVVAHDGVYTVINADEAFSSPLFTVKFADASSTQSVLRIVRSKTMLAAKAAFAKFEAHGSNAMLVAQRRSIASLNSPLSSIDLMPMLQDLQGTAVSTPLAWALPKALRDTDEVPMTLQDTDSYDGGQTTTVTLAILGEWNRLLQTYRMSGSECYMKDADKRQPHTYWLRVRTLYPRLATTMLYWLSFPVGTAGIERNFSSMTVISRDARRRRLSFLSFRAAVLSHCYKEHIRRLLKDATACTR